MAWLLASALATTGGSTSAGIERFARSTRSRTSLAACSRSRPSSNSTVIVERPSALVDVSERIPSIPLIDSSRGSVICDSTTSAFAPVYVVVTVIFGGSTSGNCRTPRNDAPTMPISTMIRLNTTAVTGRRMERMLIFIAPLPSRAVRSSQTESRSQQPCRPV